MPADGRRRFFGQTPFFFPEAHIMEQRVRARLPDIRVVLQVKVGAEIRGRVAPLFPAKAHIMPQRVLTGPPHVLVTQQIEPGIKLPAASNFQSFNPVFWVYQHVLSFFPAYEIYLYAPILLQALRAALRKKPQHAAPEDAKIAPVECLVIITLLEINCQVNSPSQAKKRHNKG